MALRYDLPHAVRVGTLALPAGAVTVAHYWSGRPMTAYHWLDDRRGTLGVYLNAASDVRLGADSVTWLDLALDVLVTASGGVEVLDDDEARDAPAWAQGEIAEARRLLIGQASTLASEVVGWTETALASRTQGNR
jgi:predicted RNA-binding protein associated with RNAse of E/G family